MLPGGILHNGQLERRFSFKPITGYTEMVFSETETCNMALPDRVTEVLIACIDKIGNRSSDRPMMETLCTGDRQYLMRRIASYMGYDSLWLTSHCHHCSEPFDINIQLSQLPVKPAGENYPFVSVNTGDFKIKLRVPTGADQKKIISVSDSKNAEQMLLESILVEVEDTSNETFLKTLTPGLKSDIESEIENISPEVTVIVNTACPDCSTDNQVSVDPYICLKLAGRDIYAEIHKLATRYHWSEDQILSLPRARRQIYLDLIDQQG